VATEIVTKQRYVTGRGGCVLPKLQFEYYPILLLTKMFSESSNQSLDLGPIENHWREFGSGANWKRLSEKLPKCDRRSQVFFIKYRNLLHVFFLIVLFVI
jgi:hypothetical protein